MYLRKKSSDEALPLYHKWVEANRQRYGGSHRMTLSARAGLADTLWALGKESAAELEYVEIIKLCGSELPAIKLQCANNLGNVHQDQGKIAEARQWYQSAYEIAESIYGKSHFITARTLTNLGVAERAMGDLSGAEEHSRRAYDISFENFGENHQVTFVTGINLVAVLADRDSISGWEEAFSILKNTGTSSNSVSSVDSFVNALCVFAQRTKRKLPSESSEAISIARQTLNKARHDLGEHDPRVVQAAKDLAACLEFLGQAQETGEAPANSR
jgi:tetratricopeptide (TPR) repeat protein